VGSLGGPKEVSDDNPGVLISLDGLKELEEASIDECELSVESVLSEKLVSLLARLLRSLPSLEPPSLPSIGLARSKPNCSKDRLKDVVLGWSVSCSCGGQLEDMARWGERGVRFLD
jgi:hypothetical protein